MQGLETVYKEHHKSRGEGFAVLQESRGAFLRKHIGTDKEILDIGCRDGQLTSTYHEGNNVTGVDIDSKALELAKKNLGINTIHADLNADWDFLNGKKFDVIVSCEFLEYIYFPEVAMERVKILLKEGGLFVGTIPHAYSIQSRIKFLLGIKEGTSL
jgi:2-polyprenyl-3-methyl-5-hydroxy-6-metoxy-1,4-benzoquinol methylase